MAAYFSVEQVQARRSRQKQHHGRRYQHHGHRNQKNGRSNKHHGHHNKKDSHRNKKNGHHNQKKQGSFSPQHLVGLRLQDAISKARKYGYNGYSVRVVSRDGIALPVTSDVRPNRIDVHIRNGRVVSSRTGGHRKQKQQGSFNPKYLVGLSLQAAISKARQNGYTVRVISRDGTALPVTGNFRQNRISLDVSNGRVVRAQVG